MNTRTIQYLTAFQVIAIVLSSRNLISFGFAPTIFVDPANQDAWIIDLLTGVYIVICYLPSLFLANKFRNIFISDYYELILGKWIGKIFSFAISVYLLSWVFVFSILLADFMKTAAYTNTPLFVIAGLVYTLSAYGALKGVNSIAKATEISLYYMLGILIIFTILGLNKMDFSVFLPILRDSDFIQLNISSLYYGAGRFSDGVFFLVLSAFLNKKYSVNKTFFIFIGAMTFFSVLLTVSTQATLGIGLAKHMNFPYYEFCKQINVFDIFNRIEFLNIVGWVLGFLLKLAIFTYASARTMKGIFNAKSEKPFIIPLMIIIFIGILASGITNNALYRSIIFVYFPYIIFFTYIIPIIVVIVYFFRRKSIIPKISSMKKVNCE